LSDYRFKGNIDLEYGVVKFPAASFELPSGTFFVESEQDGDIRTNIAMKSQAFLENNYPPLVVQLSIEGQSLRKMRFNLSSPNSSSTDHLQ
ncbi:hypothetical protein GN156_28875, partial [bacterium LRH843]|nr:hypothetical protein [bacterium LRH843]